MNSQLNVDNALQKATLKNHRMNRPGIHYSHLNSAAKIIELYSGSIPFAYFIKDYFSQNKKFGSKDRKQITRLCFAFFRLGKTFIDMPVKARILTGLKNTEVTIEPGWLAIMQDYGLPSQKPQNIFPWKDELSETIDVAAFEHSFLTQPDVFLRIRPGSEKQVARKLESSEISYEIDGTSVRIANAAKIDELLLINKEVVVQDLSSQKIEQLLQIVREHFAEKVISVYDCCAASGGKSILASDILQNIELTVSDIRESILVNLRKRFEQAGIEKYNTILADVSKPDVEKPKQYDLVIADVPCTGSGTWSRSPDQLYYFDEQKIDDYARLQNKILQNVLAMVKPGGFLLYITCSVFKRENEEQVNSISENAFKPISQKIIKGYDEKADTMFGCLLQCLQ